MISGLGIRYDVGGVADHAGYGDDAGVEGAGGAARGHGPGADTGPGVGAASGIDAWGDTAAGHPLLGRRLPDAWLEPAGVARGAVRPNCCAPVAGCCCP